MSARGAGAALREGCKSPSVSLTTALRAMQSLFHFRASFGRLCFSRQLGISSGLSIYFSEVRSILLVSSYCLWDLSLVSRRTEPCAGWRTGRSVVDPGALVPSTRPAAVGRRAP